MKKALNCYDRAIAIDPNHANAWYNKCLVFHKLGRDEEALVCRDKIISIYQGGIHAMSIQTRGRSFSRHDKVLAIDPNHANTWYIEARLMIKNGNIEQCLADLEKAFDIDKAYIKLAKKDSCFESIRNDERFKGLDNSVNDLYFQPQYS